MTHSPIEASINKVKNSRNPKKARKYRVALTEAQIKRAITLATEDLQDNGHSHTTESLRYNLTCVYEKILESELVLASGEVGETNNLSDGQRAAKPERR